MIQFIDQILGVLGFWGAIRKFGWRVTYCSHFPNNSSRRQSPGDEPSLMSSIRIWLQIDRFSPSISKSLLISAWTSVSSLSTLLLWSSRSSEGLAFLKALLWLLSSRLAGLRNWFRNMLDWFFQFLSLETVHL